VLAGVVSGRRRPGAAACFVNGGARQSGDAHWPAGAEVMGK